MSSSDYWFSQGQHVSLTPSFTVDTISRLQQELSDPKCGHEIREEISHPVCNAFLSR